MIKVLSILLISIIISPAFAATEDDIVNSIVDSVWWWFDTSRTPDHELPPDPNTDKYRGHGERERQEEIDKAEEYWFKPVPPPPEPKPEDNQWFPFPSPPPPMPTPYPDPADSIGRDWYNRNPDDPPVDPDGDPNTGIPKPADWADEVEVVVKDPQEQKKSGNDPMVNNPDVSKPWLIPIGNSLDCEKSGVKRGHHDGDRWLECPTYKFCEDCKVLMNNPVYGEPYDYRNFLGKKFTHIWTDTDQDMRLDVTDKLEMTTCTLLDTDVWGLQKRQANGNLSSGKYYCPQTGEHYYSIDMVYWQKGE